MVIENKMVSLNTQTFNINCNLSVKKNRHNLNLEFGINPIMIKPSIKLSISIFDENIIPNNNLVLTATNYQPTKLSDIPKIKEECNIYLDIPVSKSNIFIRSSTDEYYSSDEDEKYDTIIKNSPTKKIVSSKRELYNDYKKLFKSKFPKKKLGLQRNSTKDIILREIDLINNNDIDNIVFNETMTRPDYYNKIKELHNKIYNNDKYGCNSKTSKYKLVEIYNKLKDIDEGNIPEPIKEEPKTLYPKLVNLYYVKSKNPLTLTRPSQCIHNTHNDIRNYIKYVTSNNHINKTDLFYDSNNKIYFSEIDLINITKKYIYQSLKLKTRFDFLKRESIISPFDNYSVFKYITDYIKHYMTDIFTKKSLDILLYCVLYNYISGIVDRFISETGSFRNHKIKVNKELKHHIDILIANNKNNEDMMALFKSEILDKGISPHPYIDIIKDYIPRIEFIWVGLKKGYYNLNTGEKLQFNKIEKQLEYLYHTYIKEGLSENAKKVKTLFHHYIIENSTDIICDMFNLDVDCYIRELTLKRNGFHNITDKLWNELQKKD
jgi:hypothetical protein